MEKIEIQKLLQLSDIDAARKLRKNINKNRKIFGAIKKRYIIPLIEYLHDKKGKRLFTLLQKVFIDAHELEAILGIKDIKKNDLKIISIDIANYIDGKKVFNALKKEKFSKLKKIEYKKALEEIKETLIKNQQDIETISKELKLQIGQEFVLATFHIASSDMAYIILSLALETGRDTRYYDDPDDEEEGYPNTIQKISRKFGKAIEEQLAFVQIDTKELSAGEYQEALLHLQRVQLPEDIMMHLGMWSIKHLEEMDILNRYKVNDDGEVIQIIDKHNRDQGTNDEQTDTLIGYADRFKEHIEKIKDDLVEQVSLNFDPMVIEPIPWKGVLGGGFLPTSQKYQLPIRKVWSKNEYKILHDSADSFSDDIYKAINTIQKTPFCINEKLYDYLKQQIDRIQEELKKKRSLLNKKLEKEQKEYKKYSKRYQEDIKADSIDPDDIEYMKKKFLSSREKYYGKLKTFTGELSQIKELKQREEQISAKLAVIERLKQHGIGFQDDIYFVWQMDFRGRIYPVQTHLNPQSDDVARSLLLFSKEKILGKNGLRWMKIHGANLYGKDGLDKKPFDDRVAWVDTHEKEIVDTATSPYNNPLLAEASDPYQFLAFCYEYAHYLDTPDNFKSRLPIGVDGSNNGLQHISTLHQDKQSAIYVNVLSGNKDTPEDIYERVAKYSKSLITEEHKKFNKEKNQYIQKEGLFFIRKGDDKPLPENFISEAMLKIVLLDAKKFKDKGRKRRIKIIKKIIIDELTDIPSPTEIAKVIDQWCYRSACNLDKITEIFTKKNREIESKLFYRNHNGQAIETIISPHNFINDIILDLIDRNLVKANVMTDSYGASKRTKQDQIYQKLRSLQEANKLSIDNNYHLRILANYIGEINDRSIDEISEASACYMEWTRNSVSKIYTSRNKKKINRDKPISWTTPMGLYVTQVKYEKEEYGIETLFGKDRVTMQIGEDKKRVDIRKQSSGFAPNYIHSLDSTHLLMTVLDATQRGVEALMTIHDSFSTHACDVDMLLDALREQFVVLHSEPLMENLKKELEEHFSIPLNPIEYIDEDFPLEEVKKSKYFFA